MRVETRDQPFSEAGAVYLGAAILLGVHFIIQAARLWMGLIAPMVLFFFSIVYLPLLFLAAAVDEVAL